MRLGTDLARLTRQVFVSSSPLVARLCTRPRMLVITSPRSGRSTPAATRELSSRSSNQILKITTTTATVEVVRTNRAHCGRDRGCAHVQRTIGEEDTGP